VTSDVLFCELEEPELLAVEEPKFGPVIDALVVDVLSSDSSVDWAKKARSRSSWGLEDILKSP
jgi:hypothetical protein